MTRISLEQDKPMYLVEKVNTSTLSCIKEELELYLAQYLWSEGRAKNLHEQKETKDIGLRMSSQFLVRKGDTKAYYSQLSKSTPAALEFPYTIGFLKKFARRQKSILSRIKIVTLAPKKQVYPHIDFGEYYDIRNRYHLVLYSRGSKMVTGGYEKTFYEGELFYFNNHLTHEAYNESDEERIHLIFDLLPIDMSHFWRVLASWVTTIRVNVSWKEMETSKAKGIIQEM